MGGGVGMSTCYVEDGGVGVGWGCQRSCYADDVTLKMGGWGGDVNVYVTQMLLS